MALSTTTKLYPVGPDGLFYGIGGGRVNGLSDGKSLALALPINTRKNSSKVTYRLYSKVIKWVN